MALGMAGYNPRPASFNGGGVKLGTKSASKSGGPPTGRPPSRIGSGHLSGSDSQHHLSGSRSGSTSSSRGVTHSGIPWSKILWRLYAVIFIVGLWQLDLAPRSSVSPTSSRSVFDVTRPKHKYAYVTLLCDDIMAEAALVLVHSVKRTGTPHDMVVLTLNVSNRTLAALQTLGAVIAPITEPVAYPFAVTADRLAINKPCRYSKLLMWNMVQYHKIVYLDSDLLVLSSIDDLFERPQLSAVPDTLPPDKFNSGLMVLQPSQATFRDMVCKVATTVSPNVGDQGFLNSYFRDWYGSGSAHHLEYGYNALIRISVSPAWKDFIEPTLKVLHFSGTTKPWNMMVDKQFPTTRRYDYLWWQVYDEVYDTLSRAANDSSKLAPQLAPQCQRDYMAYARGHLVRSKLSIVMNCFKRFDLLLYMIRRYAALDFVHKIYIVWGNTGITPFAPSFFNVTKPIEILYSGIDSLNDRFKPIRSLETEAILMCDDDIEVNLDFLKTAFERWQQSPYRLVGFFPRAHYRDSKTKQLTYVLNPLQDYSIVLTKMFLMHGDYLHAYTCAIPQGLRDYIDFHKNCEDITMNFLVTQLSGLPPLLMEDSSKVDYGTTSGLSSRGSHLFSRSVCMNDIEELLGYMSLRNSSETVTHFQHDKAIKISKKRRLTTAVSGAFQPIFYAADSRSSNQFMGRLPFPERHSVADVALLPSEASNGAVLCIKGSNEDRVDDMSSTQYALLDFASMPTEALQLSGTTFVIHSPTPFEGRFTVLNLVSTFLQWRTSHGCFGPARVILYQDNMLKTDISAWSATVVKALLGQNAKPHSPPPNKVECFESAVVARQRDTVNSDECNAMLHTMRRTVHAFCRSLPNRGRSISILDDNDANVRVAFVGDASSWQHIVWFNYSVIEGYIAQECTGMGLSCQIAMVPRGKFCSLNVLGISRADLIVGPWGDRAMDNVVFLKPGSAVLELLPAGAREDEWKLAKKDIQCLDLRYEQLFTNLGVDPLLSWVSEQLDNLGRRGRRYREEESSYIEHCVVRHLQY